MKIAVDCEFNGFGGELISMALVAEDGQEWYGVMTLPEKIDPWVMVHVIPKLDVVPARIMDFSFFRGEMQHFLSGFEKPHIVADWYTDLVHFFSLFGGMHHAESFHKPMTAELMADIEDFNPKTPHNALSDAREIMRHILIRQGEK